MRGLEPVPARILTARCPSSPTRRLPNPIGRTFVRTVKYYGAGLGKALYTQPVFIWAQAIAFKVFITLLPLILLATGVFGLVLRQENSFTIVTDFLRGFLPAAQSEPLIDLVGQLQEASGGLTFVGAAAFIITVITLFSTLRYVIGTAMGGERHQMRSLLRGYLFDIRMALQVGVLFLISFGLTLGIRLAKQYGTSWGLDPVVLAQLERLLGVVTWLVPYALTLGMIVQLYYFVPKPKPPFWSAFWGAAVAAVLFEMAKNGFALYATYIGKFDRYAASGETPDGPRRSRRRVRADPGVRLLGVPLRAHPRHRRRRDDAPREAEPAPAKRTTADVEDVRAPAAALHSGRHLRRRRLGGRLFLARGQARVGARGCLHHRARQRLARRGPP